MADAEQKRAAAEWTAWLARPIEERQAIQDKVRATLQAHGVQAGRDMMKANEMPTPPAVLVIPADVLEERREEEPDDPDLWEPVGRLDH